MTFKPGDIAAPGRSWALAALGALVAALGLAALLGWHTGWDRLVQWAPGLTPMVYKTAVCFVALGAALLLMAAGRRRIALLPACAAGAISALTLVEYVSGNSWGILEPHFQGSPGPGGLDSGPMAPNTALCLLLLSAAVLLAGSHSRSRRRATSIALLASPSFGLSAIAFIGYVSGAETSAWGPFIPMAASTSVVLMVASIGVFVAAWSDEASGMPPWLYLAVTMAALVVTISLWQTLAASESKQAEEAVRMQLEAVRSTIQSQMQSRIAGLERAAHRWARRGPPRKEDWEFETRLLLNDLRGYRAIAWADRSLRVRWVYPSEGNQALLGADLSGDPVRRNAIETARSQMRPVLTHALGLKGGGRGLNVYAPIQRGNDLEGLIVGRFAFEDLFSSILPATLAPYYSIAVFDGREQMYAQARQEAKPAPKFLRQAEVAFGDVRWSIRIWPTPAEVAAIESNAPEVELFAGLGLSILAGVVTYLAQMAWARARAAEEARRRLEMEIAGRRQAEQELEQFFAVSPDMLCIAGFDGYFKRLNASWESTLGQSLEHLLGEPYESFIHPDDRNPTRDVVSKQGGGERILLFENRYRAGDGSYRWLRWNSCPNNERQLIFAAARDVTAEKAAAEELRRAHSELERRVRERTAELEKANTALGEREMLFRKLFEDSPIGAALMGVDHKFTNVNAALCQWLGYSASELLSFRPEDIAHAADAQTVAGMLDPMIRGGIANLRHSSRYVARDGRIVWGDLTATVIRDAGGSPLTVLGMMENITERISRDEEISRLNRELQARVDELTAVNEELESFNYSVSHDLRAPLRHIDGYTRILLAENGAGATDDARRCMERIRDGAQRMGRMIDELLELSRTSRREVSKQIIGLNALVKDVIADLDPETRDRDIEWRIGELPFAECDPGMAHRVFTNLLSNAIKYTRPRSPAVIEVGQVSRNGDMALFVRDNGVGFNMKYADKLFGVFQRLHRREDFEGTGIGLVTVQRIIHKHGGRIWAEAELEKGAAFYFTLGPCGEKQPQAVRSGLSKGETTDAERPSGNSAG